MKISALFFVIWLGFSGIAMAEDGVLYNWGKKAEEEVTSPVADKSARMSNIGDRYFLCLSSGLMTVWKSDRFITSTVMAVNISSYANLGDNMEMEIGIPVYP